MLLFKPIEFSDKDTIKAFLSNSNPTLFTFCFETLWIWRKIYNFQYAIQNNMLFVKTHNNSVCRFLFPHGNGNLQQAIDTICRYTESINCRTNIGQITPENKKQIEELFPNVFTFTPQRNEFEYIYKSERLIKLSGKKMQHKRNNINFLENNYKWNFETVDTSNYEECLLFSQYWDKELHGYFSEEDAFYEAFNHLHELNIDAGALRIDGKIEAVSIGCQLNSEVYLVLFEKANPEIRGAYSLINREFCRKFSATHKWINRAEDAGIEGLRQAKLSYYPDLLQEIFLAVKK